MITNKEIRIELEKIYKERETWNGAKGPFTKLAIKRREIILIKHFLYKIKDARLLKDKKEEYFNLVLYKMLSDYFKKLQ